MALTQDNGFEQYRDSKSGNQIIDQYHGTLAEALAHSDYTKGMPCPYDAGLVLVDITVSKDISGTRGTLTLTYAPEDSASDQVDTNKDIYTLDEGSLEKSIETHPSYRMKWNHHLAAKSGTAKPAWFDTAVDYSDTSGSSTYQWVKDYSEVDTSLLGKNFIKWDKTKPGVESYILPAPVVNSTLYFSTKKKATASKYSVGKRTAPVDKMGVATGEWLVTGRRVQQEGRKWVAGVTFTNADEWDSDLYPA